MNRLFLLTLAALFVIPLAHESFALTQSAGFPTFNVAPGDTVTMDHFWQVRADYSDTLTFSKDSRYAGSQFVTLPEPMSVTAGQWNYVPISVSIPFDYSGPSSMTAKIFACEFVTTSGQTQYNLCGAKYVFINVTP